MVQNIPDTLGDIIKSARIRAGITVEALAEQIDKTERYLYRIKNEGKKPSYDVLMQLIRVLGIDPNMIFYPDMQVTSSEHDHIARLLYNCDEKSLKIIKATLTALLENQS